MNIGVMSVIRLCDVLLSHLVKNENEDLHSLSPKKIAEKVSHYLHCVLVHINNLSAEEIKKFRSLSTGGIQEKAISELLVVMNRTHNEVGQKEVKKYLEETTGEHDQEATKTIKQLQLKIRNKIIDTLKFSWPNGNDWYVNGVSKDIRKKASNRFIEEDNKGNEDDYLDLLDYKDIIEKNYLDYKKDNGEIYKKGLSKYFSDPNNKGDKKKELKWFDVLNDIRKRTMHPERDKITKIEYENLKKIEKWLLENLEIVS